MQRHESLIMKPFKAISGYTGPALFLWGRFRIETGCGGGGYAAKLWRPDALELMNLAFVL